MSEDLLGIIDQISRQRELDPEVLVDAIGKALLQAAKKRYGSHRQISVSIDRETGEIRVFTHKKVVDIMTDFSTQIPIEEAVKTNPDIQLGDSMEVESMPSDFGRIAAQTAKQIVTQKLREAERENIYEEYKDSKGEVVSGVVQRFEQHDIILELERTEALLPQREQIRNEEYRRGDRLRALIIEVRPDAKISRLLFPELILICLENYLKLRFQRSLKGLLK